MMIDWYVRVPVMGWWAPEVLRTLVLFLGVLAVYYVIRFIASIVTG